MRRKYIEQSETRIRKYQRDHLLNCDPLAFLVVVHRRKLFKRTPPTHLKEFVFHSFMVNNGRFKRAESSSASVMAYIFALNYSQQFLPCFAKYLSLWFFTYFRKKSIWLGVSPAPAPIHSSTSNTHMDQHLFNFMFLLWHIGKISGWCRLGNLGSDFDFQSRLLVYKESDLSSHYSVCLWTGSDIILGTPQKGTPCGHHRKCLGTPQKGHHRDTTGSAWDTTKVDITRSAWGHHKRGHQATITKHTQNNHMNAKYKQLKEC